MKKLVQIFKNFSLATLLVCPLSVQARGASFFNLDSKWVNDLIYSVFSLNHNYHELYERALIEAFSEIREGGSLADNPQLLEKVLPHLTYTPNADERSDDFVRKLIAYYSPDSAAYANLPSFPRKLLANLQKMEKAYQEPIGQDEEDDLSIEDLKRLYQAAEEMVEE